MIRFGESSVGVARGALLLFSAFENGGEMWTGSGPRLVRQRVTFGESFLSEPVVHVSLGMWDIDASANQRVDIEADRITPEGFDVVFRTWGDTRVARVRAEWLAFGPVRHTDDFEV
ncbi:H-type lectin domain-containing protein [Paracoccus sp. Z118]|uniref:H-type lectin domain-containing protein n=1 Tax=Paracoccus sp. Z118 TaxID=2851017 RepID=UPI0020B63A7C|nr:H-type lectin domain-containing protein [Paracoccus sp. Z118]